MQIHYLRVRVTQGLPLAFGTNINSETNAIFPSIPIGIQYTTTRNKYYEIGTTNKDLLT